MTYFVLSLITFFSQVDATLLDGTKIQGEIKSATRDQVTIQSNGEDKAIPVSQLMEVTLPEGEVKETDTETVSVRLANQSRFPCTNLLVDANEVSVTSEYIGQTKFPLGSLLSVRLAEGDEKILESWEKLCSRENKQDLLVIQKEDVLDHLDGTVTAVTAERIQFLLDGQEVSANRKKVFGIVYARKPETEKVPDCKAYLHKNYMVNLKSLVKENETSPFRAELLSGGPVEIPSKYLKRIDYSLGKVQYLSDLEPAEVVYTPFFDVKWEYQKDRNMDGGPIRLGRKTYEKGICIHSKTYLRYRLTGDHSRFQAVMGIDDSVNRIGNVNVVISVDGNPILESSVVGEDPPKEIDLDIKGGRDLEILVDFGSNLDISDHLDLANARLIK